MVYVNHKCFLNQMMAISHPFTSCINWYELVSLMDRVHFSLCKRCLFISNESMVSGFYTPLKYHIVHVV